MKASSIDKTLQWWTVTSIVTAFMALALLFWTPGMGYAIDQSEYEYDYYEGLHEEEWYDPSDWFDEPGEGISYETDWYDSTYGYGAIEANDYMNGYYYDGYDGYYDYYDGYGYPDYNYNYYTNDWYDGGLF